MANNANTIGRLNEILFAELERLNALDATDKDALEGHPWAQDAKGDSRPARARND